MFRVGRRWFICFLSAILPVVTALLGIHLKWYSNGDVWNWKTFGFLGAIGIVSFLLSFLNHLKPVRDVANTIPAYWNVMCEPIMTLGTTDKLKPRVNVLLKRRTLRWLGLCNYLVVVWGRKMENHPDVRASFRAYKGVAGRVVKSKQPILANLEASKETWGFSAREMEQFKHLTAIYSWPVYEVDSKGDQTGAVVGTVNLDAQETGAADRIRNREEQYEVLMEKFAELVAKVVS